MSIPEGWDALDQIAPQVETDGHEFIVVYAEQFLPPYPDYDIFAAYVAPVGDTLEFDAVRNALDVSGEVEAHPCVASARSGGAATAKYFAAWDHDTGAGRDVLGALIDGPQGGAISSFCSSPTAACPCGNDGALGHGCANSVNPLGALLTVTGTPSVSHDTLTFQTTGMPATASCLFFEGNYQLNNALGTIFGDGRKCVGGTIVRFPLKGSVNGTASYPQAGDASVSAAGYVPAIGGTRYYQAWYRDPASYCSSATFNLSNAIAVSWTP